MSTKFLGYQGESNARRVKFNVGWMKRRFPTGQIILFYQRPNETEIAPRTDNTSYTDDEPDILVWTVDAWDTEKVGIGRAQIVVMDGEDIIGKSEIFETEVKAAISGTVTEDAPEPVAAWIADLFKAESMADVAEKVAQVNDAIDTIKAAEEAEKAAKEAAEMALSEADKWANGIAKVTPLEHTETPTIDVDEVTEDDKTVKQLNFNLPVSRVYKPSVDKNGVLSWSVVGGDEADAVADTSLVGVLLDSDFSPDSDAFVIRKLYATEGTENIQFFDDGESRGLSYTKDGETKTLVAFNSTNEGGIAITEKNFPKRIVNSVNGESGEVVLPKPKYVNLQIDPESWNGGYDYGPIAGVTSKTQFVVTDINKGALISDLRWETTDEGFLRFTYNTAVGKPNDDEPKAGREKDIYPDTLNETVYISGILLDVEEAGG